MPAILNTICNAIEYLANIQRTKGMEPTEPIFTTPTGKVYHIGDSLTSKAVENQETLMVLERVDEDDVWYTLPSVPEQEAVNIDRTAFERYLDTGFFSVTDKGEPIRNIQAEQGEDEQKPTFQTETVAVYPGEKNNLPYDVVIQTIRTEPEPPKHEKTNFRIEDMDLGAGGPKAKFRMNMDAINLLKELEFEGRMATPEEQEILSKYVGWGGLSDAFDESKETWAEEFKELYVTLTPEEYSAAKATTLNAHYTSPTVIQAMYDALGQMGFEGGNILEPSMGIPAEQIAFIHEANTEVRKAELFAKVRSGEVRVLIGSTAKMGPGMNVQDRLIALHHLDVPWKPSDIEQQEGRIIRQGNMFPQVKIFRYITKGTFDAYSWQLLENKQKFISQIMTSKSPVRSADDIDEAALSY